MIEEVKNYKTNAERTSEYLEKFSREKVLLSLIKTAGPTILDVGANRGQSIKFFLSIFPEARIIAFEPQAICMESLNRVRLDYPNNVISIVSKACGRLDNDDGVEFYSHDLSSGLAGFNRLNMSSKDSLNLSKIVEEDRENYAAQINHVTTVKVVRLETYLKANGIKGVNILKIDTQGFEPEVLEGMGELLKFTDVVLVELMFYDLYERSISFYDVERYLHSAGLFLFDISHISKNPLNGRTDWVDAIYVRRKVSTA